MLHVYDLPQIYTKPSADALLDTLQLLTSTPPSWECSDSDSEVEHDNSTHISKRKRRAGKDSVQINPEGMTRYLTSIVSSDLRWIKDDTAKEEIWDQASLRLSERAGRTAMSAISRKFRIPSASGPFELSIHEPALTADNLGLKTWAASYLLSKRLHKWSFRTSNAQKLQVLELGSGTGLVGLAVATVFGADVVLTDLPSIHENLSRNVDGNRAAIEGCGGSVRSGILDWTDPSSCQVFPAGEPNATENGVSLHTKFSVIVAADSLYSPEHPRLLVNTIAEWLSEDIDSTVIVEFPFREAYRGELKDFRDRMVAIGLCVLEEGEETGYDDWGWAAEDVRQREDAIVRCWWSRWGRRNKKIEQDKMNLC